MGRAAILVRNLLSREEIFDYIFAISKRRFAQADSTNLKKLETQNEARGWQAVGRLDIANSGFCWAY